MANDLNPFSSLLICIPRYTSLEILASMKIAELYLKYHFTVLRSASTMFRQSVTKKSLEILLLSSLTHFFVLGLPP